MKVKQLINWLKTMPQEATVRINLRQSKMMLDVERVNEYKTKRLGKDIKNVEIVADWRDFELDKEEAELCQEELDEERTPEEDGQDDNADELHDAIIDNQLTFGK